jgi:hypothetical protein
MWRWRSGMTTTYNVFNPTTRKVEISVSGTRYINNPRSFKIYGVYARPRNQVRAVEVYEYLIRQMDLILVSDRVQSPGGQRVWRELKRKSTLKVYGYDFRLEKGYSVKGSNFDLLYTTPNQIKNSLPGQKQQLKGIARNIRLVACQAQ